MVVVVDSCSCNSSGNNRHNKEIYIIKCPLERESERERGE